MFSLNTHTRTRTYIDYYGCQQVWLNSNCISFIPKTNQTIWYMYNSDRFCFCWLWMARYNTFLVINKFLGSAGMMISYVFMISPRVKHVNHGVRKLGRPRRYNFDGHVYLRMLSIPESKIIIKIGNNKMCIK